ncbi:MAG: hypothetical protein KO217_07680 [Methanobacteriaceae archaeon]|nr:MAG: hypothetical protein CIT01_05395 [Methanobacterium sp. BRmetb2]MCC7558553.1 hypothetical protein [Methanobacteriaceae archaeon]
MSRIIKFILFLLVFFLFFEAGLVSSYTIVTSQPPDIEKLFDFQINAIASLLNFEGLNSTFTPTPDSFNATNPTEVVEALKTKGGIDGINLDTLTITTFADTDNENFQVNITATGYKESISGSGSNKTGGTIVIAPNETYSIRATAVGNMTAKGIEINVNTIKIVSVGRLYANTNMNT